MFKSSITAVAFTLALGAVPAFAQAPTPAPDQQPPARAAQPTQVRGELVSVDETAKTITVKTTDNAEVKFAFDDKHPSHWSEGRRRSGVDEREPRDRALQRGGTASKTKLATRIIVEPKK